MYIVHINTEVYLMGYSVLDLKNAFEVREEWMEKPIIDFLEDEIKEKNIRI